MSYTTNSTANRLKINKGWKNPSFPETLPLYSRDNVFFFKLYLFLKAYFTLNRTRLIYCDLRNSENYTKILYLVINSVPKKFKKKKSYRTWYVRKTTSGLKYSQFRDANLRHAANLLYLDLPKLKKQVSAKLLPLSKQKLPKAFYRKTRYKTWINFLAKIKNVRKNNKLVSKRKNLRFAPINFHNLNIQQSFNFKLKRLKNEILVLNRFFATIKSNHLLTKQNLVLYKTQLTSLKTKLAKLLKSIAKYNKQHNSFRNRTGTACLQGMNTNIKQSILLTNNLTNNKRYQTDLTKDNTKKVLKRKISKAILRKRLHLAKASLNAHKRISLENYKVWQKTNALSLLKKTQFKLLWKKKTSTRFLSKVVNTIQLTKVLGARKLKPTLLNDNLHKQFLYNSITAYATYLKSQNCFNNQRSLAKFISVLKAQQKIANNKKVKSFSKHTFLVKNLQNVLSLNYPTNLKRVTSIRPKRARRGSRTKFSFSLLKKLRKKKKTLNVPRNFHKTYYNSTVETKSVSTLVKNFAKNYKQLEKQLKKKKRNVWKFRETFRNNYKRHTATLIKYQYKLGLQQVLLNYFKMNFEVKIVRPLAQFKNLKLLRLVYPLRTFHKKSTNPDILFKKTLRKLRKNKNKTLIPLRKRYILSGTRTKRFDLHCKLRLKLARKKTFHVNKFNKHKFILKLRKKYKLTSTLRRKQILAKKSVVKNKFQVKYTKKNTYVFKKTTNIVQRLRHKELLDFSQSRLKEARKKLLIRSFMPVASLFVKYLNPQILADHIAKEFEKTKHHQGIIYGLSQALSALPFARAKGYHIAIVGRINSSDKSRSFLLKRNVLVRQNFSRKVNFASSQARARIGSFGIKVWIFY